MLFGLAVERRRFTVDVQVVRSEISPGKTKSNNRVKGEFGGLEFKLSPEGSFLWIGHEGIVVHLSAPYPGREKLLDYILQTLAIFEAKGLFFEVKRTSVLLGNNVDPHQEKLIINDYIDVNPEFPDPNLKTLVAFKHEFTIDLTNMAPNVLAKVTIEGATQGRSGIDIKIDVLDHTPAQFSDVTSLWTATKNLQSHIFETIITDRTRELYGIRA